MKRVLVLVILALLLASCSEVAGIDTPVSVGGMELVFTDVSLEREYVFAGSTHSPSSPYDRLALVTATTNDDPSGACDWGDYPQLYWARNGEREDVPWGVCVTRQNDSGNEILFVFATYANASDITIVLSDEVEVSLDSIR